MYVIKWRAGCILLIQKKNWRLIKMTFNSIRKRSQKKAQKSKVQTGWLKKTGTSHCCFFIFFYFFNLIVRPYNRPSIRLSPRLKKFCFKFETKVKSLVFFNPPWDQKNASGTFTQAMWSFKGHDQKRIREKAKETVNARNTWLSYTLAIYE